MKVLQINSVLGEGSTGRIVKDISSILVARGHESYIAYGRGSWIDSENVLMIGNKLDIYTHVVKTRIFDLHGLGSRKATINFVEQIKKIDPDIILLHNIHGYFLNFKILFDYIKEASIPVVWTLHDCWSFTGHCAYFDFVGCEKWKTGCYECPEKNEYPRSLIFDNSSKNFETKRKSFTGVKNMTIITPSRWLATLAKESFLKEYSVRIINNGIDLDKFKPTIGNFRKLNNLENKIIVLGVASVWDRRKGLKHFIDLATKLNKGEVIVLVGVTEHQKIRLPDNIIGVTRTNNLEELVDIYSSADVFVNMTLEENFPSTNLEALACETPVITFNTGGSPESINENTGIIVEKGNVDEIAKGIETLYNKRITNGELSESVRKLYDKNDKYLEYIDLFEHLHSSR